MSNRGSPEFIEKRVSDTVYEFKAVARFLGNVSNSSNSSNSIHTLSRHRGYVFLFCVVAFIISTISLIQNWITYQLCIVVVVIVCYAGWSLLSQVTEESVLIIRDFGIQLQAKYLTGAEETKFLDKDKISGVIIHEFIRGSSVHYGLAFLMRGGEAFDALGGHDSNHIPQQSRLSLSFGHVYPGLDNLVKVYRACAEMVQSSSAIGTNALNNLASPGNRESFHGASPFGSTYVPISISGIRHHQHHPSPLWEY